LRVKEVYEKYNVWPFWYIMTSRENDSDTKAYFKENNFFEIPKDNILFFVQGELPLIREDGSKVLDENGNEVYAANGNGGIFKALEDEGIIEHMKEHDVEYICSCNVDNILINPFDEIALGVLKEKDAELGIKSVEKAKPEEKVGNIVLKDGRTTIVEYIDMPKELAEERNADGKLKYSESHFGCNYISLRLLERIADKRLPIHEAHKKNDDYGEYIKQEMFIFDGFEMAESACVIRVKREDEFAPIKNKEGESSPETAVKLYEK
jgi:UDP-N-acetylglucosamine pyrophosphorylase